MARGALRGAGTAVLSLIVLQGLVSRGGSGRVSSLINDVNGLVTRAFDPNVPAIADRSAGAPPAPLPPLARVDQPSRPDRLPIPGTRIPF